MFRVSSATVEGWFQRAAHLEPISSKGLVAVMLSRDMSADHRAVL